MTGAYLSGRKQVEVPKDGKYRVESELAGFVSKVEEAQIAAGKTSKDDVLRIIGPPRLEQPFPRMRELAWDYRYMDDWGFSSILSVMFDAQGRVKHKVMAQEPKDDH